MISILSNPRSIKFSDLEALKISGHMPAFFVKFLFGGEGKEEAFYFFPFAGARVTLVQIGYLVFNDSGLQSLPSPPLIAEYPPSLFQGKERIISGN